jgi:tetratricopeptide (TPR) repeat protein
MNFTEIAKIAASGFAVSVIISAIQSCAPRPPYRPLAPPPANRTAAFKPAPPTPPVQETLRKALPQDSKIKEQNLKSKAPPPSMASKELHRESTFPEAASAPPLPGDSRQSEMKAVDNLQPEAAAPPLPDDSSLLAKITPGVSPQRAASLRLTEEGRKLLDAGDPARAIERLERTIVIDSTNPYGYYYLAKAQYRLRHYKESLNFLDVAESRLSNEPFWLAEVYALRGENYRALGMAPEAEASYAKALRVNSGNSTAVQGLSILHGESQAPVAQH